MYEEIKKNIINNFLNSYYLWTCTFNRKNIVNDMKNHCPFPISIANNDCSVININLGDNIIVDIYLNWEEREISSGINNPIYNYRLIKIS